jgi:hypothetical protein
LCARSKKKQLVRLRPQQHQALDQRLRLAKFLKKSVPYLVLLVDQRLRLAKFLKKSVPYLVLLVDQRLRLAQFLKKSVPPFFN